jgi:PAS domain S-box-containing protein
VIVADHSGDFAFFNRAAVEMLGIGAVEATPDDWSATYGCYLPDMKTPFPTERLPLLRAVRGYATTDELMFIRNETNPNGRWLSINGRPLFNEGSRRNGGVIVFRDVTERRRSEETLERLYSAVEQTADVVIITDAKGMIEYVNPAFESVTGYDESEVVGKRPSILKSGLHDDSFYGQIWETILSGRVFRGTISNRKKDGMLFVTEQTISPVTDAAGGISHFVSVGKDITDLQKHRAREAKMLFARKVQEKFYPSAAPSVDGFDIAGATRSADETGGDYFDYISMCNGCLGIAVGDVSGHGFDAALLMSETRAYLRSLAITCPDIGRLATTVNKALAADTEPNRFVTLLFARVDPSDRRLVYWSAGHETGFILDSSGAVKSRLGSTGLPLGLFPDTVYPSSPPTALASGEIAVLLTDGVTEAEAMDGSLFGAGRTLELIAARRRDSAQEIVDGIYAEIDRFTAGKPQADDITVVICKATT